MSTRSGDDPFVKATYPLSDRLRRAVWKLCYHAIYRMIPRPFFSVRALILRMFGATIAAPSFFYPRAIIWAPWLLTAEDTVTVADDAEVYNPAGAYLGSHTIISQGAYLCGATHDIDDPAFPTIAVPIRIGKYVWIASRAILLPNATAEDGSVLGAGAVAARPLEKWTVYGGNPAKALRRRQPR